MKVTRPTLVLITALFLWGAGSRVSARQINWRCIAGGINQVSYGSSMTKCHLFELGCFEEGFVPTTTNTSEWSSHWMALDRTVYREADSAFSDSFLVEAGASLPSVGTKAYVWGYNATEESSEWLLVSRSGWTWPSPSRLALPLSWVVTSSAEVVLGSVNAASDAVYLQTAPATGTPPVLLPEVWQRSHFDAGELLEGDVSAWASDPDEDGLSNLVEYGLGTDPRSETPMENVFLAENLGSKQQQLMLLRQANRLVTAQIEYADDLRFWSDVEGHAGTLTSNLSEQQFEADLSTSSRRFYRVSVTWLQPRI